MLLLAGLCGFMILLSAGGLVWIVVTGMIQIGEGLMIDMDGLMLALICLSMGGVFTLMLLWIANDAGWLAALKQRRAGKSAEAAGSKAQPSK